MNEHDVRQYRLMYDLLQRYEEAKIPLSNLIAGLEALLEALEKPNQAWKKKFRHEWGVLEIEHAVTLDRGLTQLPVDSHARLNVAIKNLRQLLVDCVPPDCVGEGG